MKVVAYTALHYGRDYLAWAIRSVIERVDEYHVLYSAVGSHGQTSPLPCPETRAELRAIAERAAGDKLRWFDGQWRDERAQRGTIYELAPDADVVLVLDADEIWMEPLIDAVLDAAGSLRRRSVPSLRLPVIHFWRSFHRAVVDDTARPIRVLFPGVASRRGGVPALTSESPICHFGYAQRPEIVEYKQHIHGHKREWRRDCNWFEDRFMANAQQDCHPVRPDYWYPETVDPWIFLPRWMSKHPYANQDVIGSVVASETGSSETAPRVEVNLDEAPKPPGLGSRAEARGPTLEQTLRDIAVQCGLDAGKLAGWAAEDPHGGWDGGAGGWPVGSIWSVEGRILYALVRALRPKLALEFGTYHGCSTTHILQALEANRRGMLHAYDDRRGGLGQIGQLVPHALRRRLVIHELSAVAYSTKPAATVDFLFEDCDHSVETTRAVWQLADRILAPGGIVVSHDAMHFRVGARVRQGVIESGVTGARFYAVAPSDCGLAVWRKAAS